MKNENTNIKKMVVKLIVGENNIATEIMTEGLSQSNIHDLLEMEGLMENIKQLIHEKIKVKARTDTKVL